MPGSLSGVGRDCMRYGMYVCLLVGGVAFAFFEMSGLCLLVLGAYGMSLGWGHSIHGVIPCSGARRGLAACVGRLRRRMCSSTMVKHEVPCASAVGGIAYVGLVFPLGCRVVLVLGAYGMSS